MRVAFFTNSVAMGGMEKHVLELAGAVARRNCEVRAIVPGAEAVAPFRRWLQDAGIPVHVLDLSGAQPPAQLADQAWRLRHLLRSERVDVFHQHRTGPYHGKWACLIARTAGVPAVVATEHLPAFPLHGASRTVNALADRLVDRIVTVCELDRVRQLSVTWRGASKVVTIHNGVDLALFDGRSGTDQGARAAFGVEPDAPVLGVLARLMPDKGITHLLKALVPLVREWPRLVVLIAGEGPLRSALEAEAADLGVAQHVRFLGQRSDVSTLLRAIDLLVLPSEKESFPLVLLEAMAMARPAVACDVGGVSEAVADGVTGFVVPPANPPALAAAIQRCLRDCRLEAMGAAGRRRVEELFTADAMAAKATTLYRGLLAA